MGEAGAFDAWLESNRIRDRDQKITGPVYARVYLRAVAGARCGSHLAHARAPSLFRSLSSCSKCWAPLKVASMSAV